MSERMTGRNDGRMRYGMEDRNSGKMGERRDERTAGGMSERAKALRKIQQLNFAMIELGLYLNNQPKCEEALMLYDKVQRMHADAKEKYEEHYGPLTYEGVNTKKAGWSWINEPWPWEGEDC